MGGAGGSGGGGGETCGPISASNLSASAAIPLTTAPPCRTDESTTASPQYVMTPPCSILADKEVAGFVKILPPLSTEAATLATDIERMSIVPPWLTATSISGCGGKSPWLWIVPPSATAITVSAGVTTSTSRLCPRGQCFGQRSITSRPSSRIVMPVSFGSPLSKVTR